MAIKPLNSVAGFSVGEVPDSIILANGDITAYNAEFSGNLLISNSTPSWGILTDNLYYSNGQPWDLQQAAGTNSMVQFNDNNNFGATANFTWDNSSQLLSIIGNVDVTNIVRANYIYANANVWANNVNANSNINVTGTTLSNFVLANANVVANNVNANANVNVTSNLIASFVLANSNVIANNFQANSNASIAGNLLTNFALVNANAIANNFHANSTIEAVGNITGQNLIANLTVYATDVSVTGSMSAQGNVLAEFVKANSNVIANNFQANSNITANGNLQVSNANLGNVATANFVNVASNVITNNLTVNLNISGNTANFTGNISASNANLGNLATANFVNVASNLDVNNTAYLGNAVVENLTQNQIVFPDSNSKLTGSSNLYWIPANGALFSTSFESNGVITTTSNLEADFGIFSGNIEALNADLGNLAIANYVNVANDINVLGNVNASNFVGTLANGNSNVKVYGNSNVAISIGGSANIATISTTGLYVDGQINSTSGNILSNGNVTANGFVNAANANVTGEAKLGSVLTSNITATSGTITISAAGSDQNININPTGNGTVDVGLHRITQVGDPTQPRDAATKEYVDSTAQGLTIHTAVRVTSTTNLNATYANGGSVLSTIAITGGKTIQFSAAHNLSVGDEIAWDNSFNGIISNDPYFVYSTPAADTITVKAGYFGAEVTTLTNGTGLTQTARANTGVGATLTNAGANAAISIDGVSLSSTNRVLVQGQTNQVENGIYTVTTVGNGSTAWVLTRATDEDTYSPTETNALGYGDYFFVQQGSSYAGSSYVLTTPVGEILFGYTNIEFSQFSAAGSYSAGNGIAITGTTISANTDNVTTTISGGNIIVKDDAQFVTPNIGAATGTSANLTGNVTANNLSIGNVANIGANLTVGGTIQANSTISSNANISGLNFTTVGNVNAEGNVLANNISANLLISSTNANVSNLATIGNLTVNLELSGNTANFTGNLTAGNLITSGSGGDIGMSGGNVTGANVINANTFVGNLSATEANISGNLTINLELSGNTANFNGNVTMDNWLTVSNTANVGNLRTDNLLYANGQPWDLQQAAGSNNEIQFNSNDDFSASANLTFNASTNVLGVIGDANISNAVIIGETTTTWATVTTSTVTANQTISSVPVSGITGVQFLVKGIDASGSKYSVATVQAVTDGTSVDYATYGTVNLGGFTGSLAVNVVGGYLRLQVTPASGNSTVWTTQYNII